MGGVGDEAALPLVALGEAVQHRVQGDCKRMDLVVRRWNRKAVVPTGARDALGGGAQRLHGPQGSTDDAPGDEGQDHQDQRVADEEHQSEHLAALGEVVDGFRDHDGPGPLVGVDARGSDAQPRVDAEPGTVDGDRVAPGMLDLVRAQDRGQGVGVRGCAQDPVTPVDDLDDLDAADRKGLRQPIGVEQLDDLARGGLCSAVDPSQSLHGQGGVQADAADRQRDRQAEEPHAHQSGAQRPAAPAPVHVLNVVARPRR